MRVHLVMLMLLLSSVASAETVAIGKAKIVSGKVTVARGSAKTPVKVGDPLNEHDVFETGADGSLGITFTDNTSFSIGPNSHVAIDTYFFDPKNLKGNTSRSSPSTRCRTWSWVSWGSI